jgi:hypothetical protein
MKEFLKNRSMLLLVPLVVAIVWGIITYNTMVLGLNPQFSQYVLPLAYLLFAIYFFGLFFWYRIEQTGYAKKIDMMQMDVNSISDRIDMAESMIREIKDKE